jgi:hypothetical protein
MIAAALPVRTPIRIWEPELVEHIAVHAAERGDANLESLCDEVLAGETDEDVFMSAVYADQDLIEVAELGRNRGWRSRCR